MIYTDPSGRERIKRFLVQAMLPEGFPFYQFNITYYSWCSVPVGRQYKVAPY